MAVFAARAQVPKAWLEFVVTSCGGVAGWEGEGSPFTSSDAGITHQVSTIVIQSCVYGVSAHDVRTK